LSKGAKVGHYRIIERIGAGGMGEVYLAEDTELDRKAALKFLSVQYASDGDFKARFKREAQAAAKLNHPNIVTIYEVAEYCSRSYIAMEYVTGNSLEHMINQGRVLFPTALELISQVCQGLQKAHQCGIIHRDIKPGNIFVNNDGQVKILDFGLAKVEGDSQMTLAGSVLGTASYMSPEQGRGLDVDHRSDIFSVGVLLYVMLAGRSPFKRDSIAATIHAIVHEYPEPIAVYNPELPEAIQLIIGKMLAKDPTDRYQSIGDLLLDLKQLQESEGVPAAFRSLLVGQRPDVKSLAVLYLRNLGSSEDEYLSYGITEDLIVDLTRIGTIRVTPMRSVLKFKDSVEELREIAKKLDVTMVLDGSLHKSEKSVRISALLVDAATGKSLWANRWQASLDNLSRIKQALARGISQALGIDSSVARAAQLGKPEAKDPQAYQYYLQGKYAFEHKKSTADVEVARGLYRKALELEPRLLAARAGIAGIMAYNGEYKEAVQELLSALDDARKRGLRADEATIQRLLALSYFRQSRLDKAMEHGNQALRVSSELHDLVGEANALGTLMNTFLKQARFDEALALSERALKINHQLDDQQKVAEVLRIIGNIFRGKGENLRARVIFQNVLQMARKQENKSLEAMCHNNIGVVNFHMGYLDEAMHHYEQSLQIYDQLGDQIRQTVLFINIGMVYGSRGAYREAMELYSKASAIRKGLGERGGYALSQDNIARCLAMTGEYDRAISISREVLSIGEEIGDPHLTAGANENLGFAHFCRGEHERAEKYYRAAIRIAEESNILQFICETHLSMGEMDYHLGNLDLCRDHLEKALGVANEIGEKGVHLKAAGYLAALEVQGGEFDTGVKRLREILDDAKSRGDLQNILNAQRLIGQALLENGPDHRTQDEGHTILQSAYSLAKDKEISHEAKWIGRILDRCGWMS
jgi:non-specific serine/threonine protein kinase